MGRTSLWAQVTLIHKGALALSVVLMAMTIVLGVVRWRMVLRVHGLEPAVEPRGEIARRTFLQLIPARARRAAIS